MHELYEYEAMTMLDLPDEEKKNIGERFNALIGSFAKLEQIEADRVEPLVTVLDLHSVLREDISIRHLSRDEIMANTSWEYDGYFQVPGTLV